MAKKKKVQEEEIIEENIVVEPLEEVMGDRYAVFAKAVIQDRAIPDVRDGLKPVQRRIIFSMYNNGNVFNKPTKKCAHTVGEVMGKYHPHGDSSIYDALSRMSQDWKVRYPLVNFQGNNGSIDGDSPAAYRYTESRLSKLSNELIRDIEKNTVDMELNFDDTEFEPVVLPSRFPNLLVNGSEGIAVAMATDIPPHNLNEVIDTVIYRLTHKSATIDDLLEIVQGPDFPTGGIIYRSEGLKSIYTTGKGRIEVASKAEIIKNGDIQQIIITEIPYRVVKINIAFEIDKIRHSKSIDGILEVRDESDHSGIRIVVDIKKEAKADLILTYLMNKTSLKSSYTANMVAIVDGRPRTLNLLQFIDAYIAHQIDVVTRKVKFDLNKFQQRLHIVNGLIIASLNINEVVDIIRKSKDKADSKVNLIKRFDLSNEQAEAIVMMPLYKLSHTDELVLEQEKMTLEKDVEKCQAILADPNKLNRVIISDLKAIKDEYGDERRTAIEEKGEVQTVDKRQLIAKEEQIISLTRDGYAKRSSIKSFKSSNGNALPGLKTGDVLIGCGSGMTTDYLLAFTNRGNYVCIPVHRLTENRYKEEGTHLNQFVTFETGEKIIKGFLVSEFRNDIYLAFLTKLGQIKRMSLGQIDYAKHNRPVRCMRIVSSDEVASVQMLTGNSDILIFTNNGNASMFNENELTPFGLRAGGVKAVSNLGKNYTVQMLTFDEQEKTKIVLVTDGGCERIFDNTKIYRTSRLGKLQPVFRYFKSEPHSLVRAIKVPPKADELYLTLYLNDSTTVDLRVDDFHLTDINKNAKKNINIPPRTKISFVYGNPLDVINADTPSHPIVEKQAKKNILEVLDNQNDSNNDNNDSEDGSTYEQISIFEDLD